MLQIMTFAFGSVLRDCRGVSATEYTAMVVGIAALVVGGAQVLGGDIRAAPCRLSRPTQGRKAKI
jgi:Flp pilus assembly pilin Flp